jgi:hypothetical protein
MQKEIFLFPALCDEINHIFGASHIPCPTFLQNHCTRLLLFFDKTIGYSFTESADISAFFRLPLKHAWLPPMTF